MPTCALDPDSASEAEIIVDQPARSAVLQRRKEKREPLAPVYLLLAEWTGLEPATPGVTGRYSNQLNYHSSRPVR